MGIVVFFLSFNIKEGERIISNDLIADYYEMRIIIIIISVQFSPLIKIIIIIIM